MAASTSPVEVDLVGNLQALPVSSMLTVVLLVGVNTLTDGLGGFYRWTAGDTSAADTSFFNVIPSTFAGAPVGNWIRVFQRAQQLPQGVLVLNGGVRTLYAQGKTDTNGQIIVNATTDGTATGTALFKEIWQTSGDTQASAGANNVVSSSRTAVSSDLKQVTYQFSRGNTTTLGNTLTAILGTVMTALQALPSQNVTVVIVGR